jgi:hypothetical protein
MYIPVPGTARFLHKNCCILLEIRKHVPLTELVFVHPFFGRMERLSLEVLIIKVTTAYTVIEQGQYALRAKILCEINIEN